MYESLYLLFCALVSSNFFFAAAIHPCFLFCVKCKIKATHATRKKKYPHKYNQKLGACQKKLFSLFFPYILARSIRLQLFLAEHEHIFYSVAFAFAMARHKFHFFSFIVTTVMFSIKKGNI